MRRIYHKNHSPKLITVTRSKHTLTSSALSHSWRHRVYADSLPQRTQPMLVRGYTWNRAAILWW